MKTKLIILTLLSCVGLFLLIFSGCYTQLASMRDEQEGDEEYTTTGQQNNDSIISENEGGEYRDESGCCEDSYRPHVGYSYYYPSSYWPSAAFSLAYADPWFYDYAWRYSSWYNYYSSAWYPYYGYNPYYYNPAYYYGNDYGYGTSLYSGGRRTDGSILSAGRDRDVQAGGREIPTTGRNDFNLPVGASLDKSPSSAPPNRNKSNMQNDSRRKDAASRSVRRDDWGPQRRIESNVRASSQGDRQTQNSRRRDTGAKSSQRGTNTPPPTYQTPPRTDRGNAPSYTPPPSPPPRQSSPPQQQPSNSGSKRNDGGNSNSGDSRSRRP